MDSWYGRLMSLDLASGQQSVDFVPEPTFVCGPHFVGKSRILQQICDSDRNSNVSSINYKNLIRNHSRNYILNFMNRRIDSKIYEHSTIQLMVNETINEYLAECNIDDAKCLTRHQMDRFVKRCKRISPTSTETHKNLIILIDTTSCFFTQYETLLPSLRLQTIAYLAIMTNFKNVAKFIVSYDERERDSTLESHGIYDLLYEHRLSTNRNVRIVDPERFDAVARQTVLKMHKREIPDAIDGGGVS